MPIRKGTPCLEDFWVGRVDCQHCSAHAPAPFGGVDTTRFKQPLTQVGNYLAPSGTSIYAAGEPAKAVFTIRDGFVKLWRRADDGHCRILRLLRPGEVMGLEALSQPRYQLSAAALTAVELCRIPVAVVHQLRQEAAELHMELDLRWQAQQARTDELLLNIATGPSRERVIKLLRHLAELAAPGPCPRVRRLDMAALLDISSETAARVMADLKHAGLLEEKPDRLLFDPERL